MTARLLRKCAPYLNLVECRDYFVDVLCGLCECAAEQQEHSGNEETSCSHVSSAGNLEIKLKAK